MRLISLTANQDTFHPVIFNKTGVSLITGTKQDPDRRDDSRTYNGVGKSLIIEHGLPNSDNSRFCTIYGHTNPHVYLHVGSIVKGGDIIATIVDSIKSKHYIFPHLHISLGWTSKSISYDRLDWETIGAPNTLTLLDPLHVIDSHYPAL